jgi:hypothetical protein
MAKVSFTNPADKRDTDFKLYKMIARTVNNLVPSEQLKQNIFKKYVNPDGLSEANLNIIDIDALPKYV